MSNHTMRSIDDEVKAIRQEYYEEGSRQVTIYKTTWRSGDSIDYTVRAEISGDLLGGFRLNKDTSELEVWRGRISKESVVVDSVRAAVVAITLHNKP